MHCTYRHLRNRCALVIDYACVIMRKTKWVMKHDTAIQKYIIVLNIEISLTFLFIETGLSLDNSHVRAHTCQFGKGTTGNNNWSWMLSDDNQDFCGCTSFLYGDVEIKIPNMFREHLDSKCKG